MWTLLNSQPYYQQLLRDVSVSTESVMFTGNMRVQFLLSYNTLYNVSVTQHSICQQLIRTMFLERNFSKLHKLIIMSLHVTVIQDKPTLAGKCGNPMELTNTVAVGYSARGT